MKKFSGLDPLRAVKLMLPLLLFLGACSGGGSLSTDPDTLRETAEAVQSQVPAFATPEQDLDELPPPQVSQGEAPPADLETRPLTDDGWQVIEPGVDYKVFTEVPGTPESVHVARLSLNLEDHPDLTIDTLKGGGYLDPWSYESLYGQVRRYTGTINYWGDVGRGGEPYWGKRSRILVAINGSLVDTQTTFDGNDLVLTEEGLPNQGMVQSGWYFDRFQDLQNRSGFVWKMDGEAFIGGCVNHPGEAQNVQFDLQDPDSDMKISGINVPRTADRGLFLYTPQYGTNTRQEPRPNTLNLEVVVQLPRPLIIAPEGSTDLLSGGQLRGEILQVRVDQPPAPIEFDQVVLSAYGFNAEKLLSYTQGREGDQVAFHMDIEDNQAQNCQEKSGHSWTEAYAALGVDSLLVENGASIGQDFNPAPRTAVAGNQDYVYLIVAEGKPSRDSSGNPIRSGISLWALGDFIVQELDGEWAANLDGGGSSTMIIDGQIVTTPGDFLPMICPQAFGPLVIKSSFTPGSSAYPGPDEGSSSQPGLAPQNVIEGRYVTGVTGPGGVCQRPVINGLAIVLAEPEQYSRASRPPEESITLTKSPLRQGPGKNFAEFDEILPQTPLTIKSSDSGLDGIYATGTYWWYVQVDEQTGWVDEAVLSR